MKTYTRKQINQQTDRFRKTEFVIYEDALDAIIQLTDAAIKAGTDEEVLVAALKCDDNG